VREKENSAGGGAKIGCGLHQGKASQAGEETIRRTQNIGCLNSDRKQKPGRFY
jgi:hypothetical protein